MARPDFRATAARRLSEERELSPAIVSLLSPDSDRATTIRNIPLEQIEPNPQQPRLAFDQEPSTSSRHRSASTASCSRSCSGRSARAASS